MDSNQQNNQNSKKKPYYKKQNKKPQQQNSENTNTLANMFGQFMSSKPKFSKDQKEKKRSNIENILLVKQDNTGNTSYNVIIGKCYFYEINNHTFLSTLMKRVAEKFLKKGDDEINEILVRAQGRDSCKKIKRIYTILSERLVGVSTIYHKCSTRMVYGDNGGKNEDQKNKKTIEVIFIKSPSDRQRSMKGFKQPQKDGEIMDYDQYQKMHILKKDIEMELGEEKEDELHLAEALYLKSYLQNNQEYEDNNINDQDDNEEEEEEEKQNSESDEDDYDDSSDEEEDNQISERNNYYEYLSQNQLLQRIEQKSQQLNPYRTTIQKDDLNLTSSYMLTLKATRQPPAKIKEMEQESEKAIQMIDSKIENLKQTNKPISSLSNQDQRDIVKGLLFKYYREEGHNVQITNKDTQQNSYTNSYQSQLILTGQTQNLKYIQLKVDDKQYSYSRVVSDPKQYSEFINKFLAAAEVQYGVPKSQITILGIQKGSIEVHYKIPGVLESSYNPAINEFEKAFPKAKISLTVKSLIDNYQIDNSYFDERYNMQWPEYHNNMADYRGSLPRNNQNNLVPQRYYFPVGFQGYGINVQKWLKEDSKWFGANSDPSVWIVLYHGTDIQGFQGITKTFIQPGNANAYGGSKCRLTGQNIKSGQKENSYFSDLASGSNSSEDYCKKYLDFGGKRYKVMFQCRVNPSCVKSPESNVHYYTVESQYAEQNVRPYRVLLKEC